jgi:hypothetical protein
MLYYIEAIYGDRCETHWVTEESEALECVAARLREEATVYVQRVCESNDTKAGLHPAKK